MKTKSIHRSLGAWLLPIFFALSVYYATIPWIVVSLLLYFWIAITITAGYHRYFTHNMYSCSKFWEYAYSITGCISINSSPVEWSSVHILHHKHSDTDNDPYDSTYRHFLRFKDRIDIKLSKHSLKMLRDPRHKFFFEHSFSLSVIYLVLVCLLFGIPGLVFLYGLPISLYLVTSGIHTITAHKDKTPRNYWFLEFLIPMAGEWIHKEHHNDPRIVIFNYRPEFFDLGGFFIKVISRAKSIERS